MGAFGIPMAALQQMQQARQQVNAQAGVTPAQYQTMAGMGIRFDGPSQTATSPAYTGTSVDQPAGVQPWEQGGQAAAFRYQQNYQPPTVGGMGQRQLGGGGGLFHPLSQPQHQQAEPPQIQQSQMYRGVPQPQYQQGGGMYAQGGPPQMQGTAQPAYHPNYQPGPQGNWGQTSTPAPQPTGTAAQSRPLWGGGRIGTQAGSQPTNTLWKPQLR